MVYRRVKPPLTVHPKSKFPSYDLELVQWRQAIKDKISQYRTEFWESQREVENQWLANYNHKLLVKHKADVIKRRESIIRIAKHTQVLLENKKAERESQQAIESRRAAKKLEYDGWALKHIQMMNISVKSWFTPENLDKNLKETVILPKSIDHSVYYSRLRQDAVLASFGRIEGESDYFNNREETLKRNSVLIPAFANIKSLIKHLTYTPAHALEVDYESSLQNLIETGKAEEEDYRALRQKYVQIYEASLAMDEKPEVFLKKAQKQLNLLLQVLYNWQLYAGVLKMDDNQAAHYAEMNYPLTEEEGPDTKINSDDEEVEFQDRLEEPMPEDTEDFEDQAQLIEARGKIEDVPTEPSKQLKLDLLQGSLFDLTFGEEERNMFMTDFNMYNGDTKDSDEESSDQVEQDPENEEGLPTRSVLEILLESVQDEKGIESAHDLFRDGLEFPNPDKMTARELNIHHNPSFTLEALRIKVEAIEVRGLTNEAFESRQEILESIQHLTNYKVDEPQLLMKVFELHRYKRTFT